MTDQISTIILRVDLDCHQCYKKIRKILCNLQDQERIRTISFDTNNNAVIIDGPFDPHKLSCKIRCKGGKVIKGVQIMGDGKPEQMAGPPPPSNGRKKKSKSKGKGTEHSAAAPPAEQPPAYNPQPPTDQPQAYYPPPPNEQQQPPEYHPPPPSEQPPAYHPQPPAEQHQQPPEYHPPPPPPDREMASGMPPMREEERPQERPAELETPKDMQVHFVPDAAAECHKNPRERHRYPMGETPSWPGPPMMEIPALPARPVRPCICMCCSPCHQGYYESCRCSNCGRAYGHSTAVVPLPPAGCYGGARRPYYGGYQVICEEDQAAACVIM